MKKIKIGLLPLYIKLYDDLIPSLRDRLGPFYEKIAALIEQNGIDVIRTPFCRVSSEFEGAIKNYEENDADCIVTLHMAYSPSLESEKYLAKTALPIVVMDTTETFEFGPMQNPAEINYNHGIHGVMDMCNLLRRNNKKYEIAAGHYENSDVISQTCNFVRAAAAAKALKGSKVGVFGGAFDGMGDFMIDADEIKTRFGVEMIQSDPADIKQLSAAVTENEIEAEKKIDKELFEFAEAIDEEKYNINIRSCLTIRKWIEKHGLSAFSVNFLKVTQENGLGSMPFIEACKAMNRGIGYAGEGDALNAALMGALLKYFPESSFVEIFCPDWKDNTLMISHMGEMNYRLADGKPQLHNVSFNYTDAEAPVVGYARFKGGNAVYANIYKDENGYKMLVSPVEMCSVQKDNFPLSIRGWLKPKSTAAAFLKQLSIHGATHHSLLVYDVLSEHIAFFGKLLGMEIVEI